jgi:hypothetical protein
MQDIIQFLDARSKNFPSLDSIHYSYKLAGSSFGIDVPIIRDLEIDESTQSLFIPAADGNRRDGVGDLVEVTGILTERHQKRPLILFDHGKSVQLPIARARKIAHQPDTYSFTVNMGEKTAGCRAYFYTGKEDCDESLGCKQYDQAVFSNEIFDMCVQDMIGAGSIGYQIVDGEHIPPDYNRGIPQGMHLKSINLLEVSLVVLACNQDTVGVAKSLPYATKSLSTPNSYPAFDKIQSLLTGGRICGKPATPLLIKALEPYRATKKSTIISGWKAMHPVGCKCAKCAKKLEKSCSCSSCSQGHACSCGTKHIEKSGDGYDLVSKKTGKPLGYHPTKEAARKQEEAIEISKHGKSLKDLRNKYKRPLPEQVDKLEALKQRAGKVVPDALIRGVQEHLKPQDKSLSELRMKYLKKDGEETKQPSQRRSATLGKPNPNATGKTPEEQGKRQNTGNSQQKPISKTPPAFTTTQQQQLAAQQQQSSAQQKLNSQQEREEEATKNRGLLTNIGRAVGKYPRTAMAAGSALAGMAGYGTRVGLHPNLQGRQEQQAAITQPAQQLQSVTQPTTPQTQLVPPVEQSLPTPQDELTPQESQSLPTPKVTLTPPVERPLHIPQAALTPPVEQPDNTAFDRLRNAQEDLANRQQQQEDLANRQQQQEDLANRQQQQEAAEARAYALKPHQLPALYDWLDRVRRRDPETYHRLIERPKPEIASIFLHYGTQPKSLVSYERKALDTNRLKNLRHRYGKNDNRMRVLRHGKPTSAVIHTSSKNLDKLRKEAGDKGVEVKWLSDDGKGITKIKLSGTKDVLDKFANAYGKRMSKKRKAEG